MPMIAPPLSSPRLARFLVLVSALAGTAGGMPSASRAASPTPSDEPGRHYAGPTEIPQGYESGALSTDEPANDESIGGDVVVDSGTGLFEDSIAGTDSAGPDGSVRAAAAQKGWGFDLDGYVRGDVFVGKTPKFSQGEIKAAYGELALKARVSKERFGDAYGEARLRFGQQGDRRALIVDLREAYVDLFLGPLDLRLGQQIVVWGRADALNPTNNLTPVDWRVRSPLEDDRRVGNVGARMFLNFAPVRIEGVWMPLYSPIEYPPFEPVEHVEIAASDFPKPYLNNGIYAGRVHLELPKFEMSGSYLFGHALLPGLTLASFDVGMAAQERLDAEQSLVRVARKAYQHHVAGFDFSTAIGEIIAIRGEAAYRHPVDHQDDIHAARPDLQYVLGLDRAVGPVTIIGQYMGRYVFDWQRDDGPMTPVDPTSLTMFEPPLTDIQEGVILNSLNAEIASRNQTLFSQLARVQHLVTARLEWLTLHDTLSVSALGMVNFTTWEWLIYPKVGYQISDHMSAYVGGEIYMGPDGTLLGWIDEILSAGYAELRFAF